MKIVKIKSNEEFRMLVDDMESTGYRIRFFEIVFEASRRSIRRWYNSERDIPLFRYENINKVFHKYGSYGLISKIVLHKIKKYFGG